MKQHVRHDPVVLTSATPDDDRIVKSVALNTFRAFRWLSDTVTDIVSQAPAVISQAAEDVVEAWEESARPPKS